MYRLVSELGSSSRPRVQKELFWTEDEAVDRARALFAFGEALGCTLQDENGKVIADEAKVLERCKSLTTSGRFGTAAHRHR
jgi:hypothetical protein